MQRQEIMKSAMSLRQRKQGFTLIELLVVIAIIALLAAILFPVFARVRENARKTSCQSNLKQIALAFQQYNQDNDGRFPHAWDISDTTKIGDGVINPHTGLLSVASTDEPVLWPGKLEPYLKNRQVYTCPSNSRFVRKGCVPAAASFNSKRYWAAGDPVMCTSASCVSAFNISYGYNYSYLGGGIVNDGQCMSGYFPSGGSGPVDYSNGIGAAESDIANPAGMLLLIDNSAANRGLDRAAAFANIIATIGSNQRDIYGELWCKADGTEEDEDTYDPLHLGGMNVAFVDGHVKWMKKEAALYTPSGTTVPCSGLATSISTDEKFIWNRF